MLNSNSTINPKVFIEINVDDQVMLVNIQDEVKEKFIISTSQYGIGGVMGSKRTPLGKHIICEKIGNYVPMYTVFKSRINTGEICQTLNQPTDEDLILTRILRLKGQQPGINAGYNSDGENVDSYDRYIYIHGTNREDLLSHPSSHGCIRMANADIINLFDLVEVGTMVDIKSKKKHNYCG